MVSFRQQNGKLFMHCSTQSTVQSTGGLLSGMFSSSSESTGAVQEDDGTVTRRTARFVLVATGGRPVRPDAVDLRWVGAMLFKNGVVEETGLGAAVLNHPATGVAWLANKIAPYGEFLRAGDVVLPAGVHEFTTVTIPAGVTVRTDGAGVLELRATGAVSIAGTIALQIGKGSEGGGWHRLVEGRAIIFSGLTLVAVLAANVLVPDEHAPG